MIPAEECLRYEQVIDSVGPIDLQDIGNRKKWAYRL